MNIHVEKKITNLRKLAISCGGTGGHFLPGLTIGRQFIGRHTRVMMLLSGKNVDSQSETAEGYGIEIVRLKTMPPPSKIGSFIRFFLGTIAGTIAAVRAMRKFRPDALLSMGSFASLPPVLAAKMLGIPIFLHDGNARIGRANRFLSSWARLMGTAFPPVNADKIKCPYEYIGMPIRPELDCRPVPKVQAINKINSLFELDFKPELPTLLIFGGSQGAQTFNEVFPKTLIQSGRTDFQVMHLTGDGKFDSVNEAYKNAKFPVLCLAATSGMHWFYQAADAVICRSGGSTLAELCMFGKFSLLIPYPFASEGHQLDNARFMEAAGIAKILDNDECTVERATELLNKWLADPEDFTKRGQKAIQCAKPDAASDMLWLIDSMI